jgi:DNA replication ATP-dependent helicase Dna2
MANAVVSRNLPSVRNQLTTYGFDLNPTQWQAWEDSLTHRCRLVWGPPGTGKSRTVRAIVVGAILEAYQAGRPFRILVTASTYNAIDNVLLPIAQDLHVLVGTACNTYRFRSYYQPPPNNISPAIDVELNRRNPSQLVRDIRSALLGANELIVVVSSPEQLYNLLTCDSGSAQAEWFDLLTRA